MISKATAEHFVWREVCDGWTLLDEATLHVVQERMPPRTAELRHLHESTRQLYYVLDGRATVDVGEATHVLGAGDAVGIPPQTPHQLRNDSSAPLEFLVISDAPPRADRRDLT